MKRKSKKSRSAFTLIEVVVVIVILVTLASIATPLYMNYLRKAKRDAAMMGVSNIKEAVNKFHLDTGRYPESLEELVKQPDEDESWGGPYLEKVPKDPWNNDYEYRKTDDSTHPYEIICYGADGQPGGEGDDADIKYPEDADEDK